MKALYRLGDVAGALSTYAQAHSALIEHLGIEPGAELRRLHRSILDGDLEKGAGRMAASAPRPPMVEPAEPEPHESRTPVTSYRRSIAVPAELPADLVDFVGRDAEVEQVLALLGAPGEATAVPMCGIVGQAGVGKTSVAVHIAHRLRATYPDGQVFVDLRGADSHPLMPGEVLARFLRALGVPGQAIPHDAQERAALYRSLLADRRLLIVLDNAANEEQVRPLLPGTPTCAVLVTSRHRLPGLVGLVSVDLGVLGTESALALLGKAAGVGRVRAEPAAAEELTRLCDGLPLALRVVGVKLAASPHRTLSVLAERLAEERHRLDQLSHSGLAVRSSLDFSYQRIDPAGRRLLRRVSLLDAPDFAAWTAAALADQAVPVVEEGLDRLIAAHLVHVAGTDAVGQVRYRMHDLIRVYARERATAEDPEAERLAVIRNALHHWLGLATAAEEALYGHSYRARLALEIGQAAPDHAARDRVLVNPLAWVEAERVALVAAVRQAAEVGMLAECWRLACVSGFALNDRELVDESRTVHTVAVDAARRLGDRRGEAVALTALGRAKSESGDWAQSRSILESAEAIFIAESDEHGLAVCHFELAFKDRYEGRLGSAKDRYSTIIESCQDRDPAMEAMGLRGLGQIQLLAGNPNAALPLLESALEVSGQNAGIMPRLLTLVWYGEACLQLGEIEWAATAFRDVASWTERLGAVTGEVWCLCGLAQVALAEGDLGEAERLAIRAHRLCHLIDQPFINILVSYVMASVKLARGDRWSAKKHAEDALGGCRRFGTVAYHARTLHLLAEIHEAGGDHDAAAAARAEAAGLHPVAEHA